MLAVTITALASTAFTAPLARRGGGFIGQLIGGFIRWLIYDTIITGTSNLLGVSRLAACLMLLGFMAVGSGLFYVLRHRAAGQFSQQRAA